MAGGEESDVPALLKAKQVAQAKLEAALEADKPPAIIQAYTTLFQDAATALDRAQGAAAAGSSTRGAAELVQVMEAGFKNVVATLTAHGKKPAALASALSSISQQAWKWLEDDLKLEIVCLNPEQLPSVAVPPATKKFEWIKEISESGQKDKYMEYIMGLVPLDDKAEWVQGDQYSNLLTADVVHRWPTGEDEMYQLVGTPDAAVILKAYSAAGLPWEGIRVVMEVKKKIEMKWRYEAYGQLICANVLSKFKPIGLLSDLEDEWHLNYMSGKTLYTGKFSSRDQAVAFLQAFLRQETVVEAPGSKEPLATVEPDQAGFAPVLKRARYTRQASSDTDITDVADITDLADCLPRQEACEVLCRAGLQDLMRHYRPLAPAASFSMYS